MSFFSRFSPSNPENMERRFFKEQAEALEGGVGKSMTELRQLFHVDVIAPAEAICFGSKNKSLEKNGLNAVIHTEEISFEQFPLMVNILKNGRVETSFRLFERSSHGVRRVTMLATEDRFAGKTVRLLTNDVELLRAVAAARFGPPPPWIVWYELGPFQPYTQGDSEYWKNYIWDPYWGSLGVEEKDKFISDWREKTKPYILDEEWVDWVYSVRGRDK
ncbi:hypothetical protein [Burkholderia sp. LMG 32019]|uniref:hypothetical protein n=1 Tax=Burkholderia sp. LMG 32019 TaxID=3158173 RepID=UPI003C2E2B3A